MKKIAFVSNIMSHITGFHVPYLRFFKEKGYEVHIITNTQGVEAPIYCDKVYDLDFERSPFAFKNVLAIREAYKIMKEEQYDIVHCHTPMGGVLGRIASLAIEKDKRKVLYTAHGFHFFKGSSYICWICFYPIERILARLTDCIITINDEDYVLADKYFGSKKTSIYKINGIGVDLSLFSPANEFEKNKLREKYGYDKEDIILFYAAEFIPRKNQKFLIDNARHIVNRIPNVKIVLAGKGIQLDEMKEYVLKTKTEKYVNMLGFRKDIPDLLRMSDILVSASKQEGLPINMVEGMASGLPVIASNIRGHKDLVINNENGWLFECNDSLQFINGLSELVNSFDKYAEYSRLAVMRAKQFSLEVVEQQMEDIYDLYL